MLQREWEERSTTMKRLRQAQALSNARECIALRPTVFIAWVAKLEANETGGGRGHRRYLCRKCERESEYVRASLRANASASVNANVEASVSASVSASA
eukprot:4936600-Pleurochrysis_carterae.AAC.2